MAAESGSQGGNARGAEAKFDAYLSAQSSLKMVRMVMLLVFVVIALFSVYRMIEPGVDLARDKQIQEELVANLQSEFEKRIVPELTNQGKELFENDIIPFLKSEAERRMQTQVPEMERMLREEVELLLKSLQETLQATIANRAEDFSKRMIDRFTQEFPELADENKAGVIMHNLEKAANSAGERVMDTYLRDHAAAIQGIALALESVPVPENIRRMSNDELFEYAMGLVADLIASKFDIERELSVGTAVMSSTDTIPAGNGQL